MDDKELFDRLPGRIGQWSDDHRGLVELYKSSEPGRCFIETGDPYCDPEMPWSDWVAFAEKIIAADRAARGADEWMTSAKKLVDAENAYWGARYQSLVAQTAIHIALGLDDGRAVDLTARHDVEGHQ